MRIAASHVYVVDDNADVRMSVVFSLRSLGYEGREFSSGRAFVDALPDLEPGCVLLDLRMPDLDGVQVLEAMALSDAAHHVIIMTGHGDIAAALRALRLGADDFLEKPFDDRLLRSMLADLCGEIDHHALQQSEAEARQAIARLTPAEAEVMHGLIGGTTDRAVADHLAIEVGEVEVHRANLMDRLNVHTRSDVLRIATRAGLTRP